MAAKVHDHAGSAHTTHTATTLSDADVDAAVRLLKLLADPTRLRIVWALLHGEHAVNDLADHVGARPTAVSQHLAKLRAADVVTVRRDGNRIFYATRDERVARVAADALPAR